MMLTQIENMDDLKNQINDSYFAIKSVESLLHLIEQFRIKNLDNITQIVFWRNSCLWKINFMKIWDNNYLINQLSFINQPLKWKQRDLNKIMYLLLKLKEDIQIETKVKIELDYLAIQKFILDLLCENEK